MSIFAFEAEEIGEDLSLLPLAARRALDAAGLHVSLDAWREIPLDIRRDLVLEGAKPIVEARRVARMIDSCGVPADPIPARGDPDPTLMPEDLRGLLGHDRSRVEAAWSSLRALDRFAIAHIARRSVARGGLPRVEEALAAIMPTDLRRGAEPRIRESKLSVDEAINAVSHPSAGGISVFLGVVRDHQDGRPVTLLEYEAYRTMAEAELERIEREIESTISGVRVFTIHRVGSLAVGELAVVCAASAPHRGEAFKACRRLIDELKSRLPIWKREHGPEGPYWVGWEDARCHGDHEAHDHSPRHATDR